MRGRLAGALVILAVCAAPARAPVRAQDRLEGVIAGAGFTPIKIAIPDASTTGGYTATTTELVETLRQDLEFSPFFDVLDPSLYQLVPASPDGAVRHEDWLPALPAALRDDVPEPGLPLGDSSCWLWQESEWRYRF